MSFYAYDGVSDEVLDRVHTASTGETYTLRHSESLKVEMPYLGKGKSNANSQGWERNSAKYFDALYRNHPEMFSKKNAVRIKEGHAPIVDAKMVAHNPGWAQYKNQPLIHHHIGGDGEAVAVPKNAHKGQGEIHNHEKSAGITDHCKNFSKLCGQQADSTGKTTSQLHSRLESSRNSCALQDSTVQKSTPVSTTTPQKAAGTVSSTRKDAVRNSAQTGKQNSSSEARSDSVRIAVSSYRAGNSHNRSDSVRNSASSAKSSGQSHTSISNGASQSAAASGSHGSSHGHSSTGGSQSK